MRFGMQRIQNNDENGRTFELKKYSDIKFNTVHSLFFYQSLSCVPLSTKADRIIQTALFAPEKYGLHIRKTCP